MRLLVVTQYFWPEDFRINDLVSEFVRRGHDVTVLTGRPNYPSGRVFSEFREQPGQFSTYEGARIMRVPMLARGRGAICLALNYLSFALSATVFGVLRLRADHFDAVLVFEPSPVTVGLPAIALRGLKKWPIAFWVLDQWPETLSAVGVIKSRFALRLIGRLVSFIYSRCDLILVPSKSLVTGIRRYCRPDQSIGYFPNWAESTYQRGASPATEVPVSAGAFNVMFAGNIGESQDFPTILDAAEQLASHRHIRWLIVGDGRMSSWVRKEVARRGLQEQVILLGRHAPERMPAFFRHAGALLVSLKPDPVFSITVPGKIQSYLAFGLPILGMLDGEGARVIEEADAGLTCPAGQAQALADIVLRVAAMSDASREAMGAKGQAYASEQFDRDRLVNRLDTWLVELASNAVSRAGA